MLLGFGDGENETAMRIIGECADALAIDGNAGVLAIKEKYDTDAAMYKQMSRDESPERCSYFWFSLHTPYNGKHIVEFTIHHLHRRHPLSPDGWTARATRWVLIVNPVLFREIFRSVEG